MNPMHPSDQEIENILRTPPRRTPPPGLKEKLIADIRLPAILASHERPASPLTKVGWLKRWWPIFAPVGLSLACAAALIAQQPRLRQLEAQTQAIDQTTSLSTPGSASGVAAGSVDATELAADYQKEIARLKEQVAGLAAEVGELRRLKTENSRLRAQLAVPSGLGLTPEEAQALADAQERAQAIACVNNLKQLGLAVRVWALDNDEVTPPDLVCLSNELVTPKILLCPADKGHTLAPNWSSCSAANLSYEFLAPSDKDADSEPTRVLSRCPIHGNVGLCDGSVQRGIARTHPEWFVERNGKLYLEREPATSLKQP